LSKILEEDEEKEELKEAQTEMKETIKLAQKTLPNRSTDNNKNIIEKN